MILPIKIKQEIMQIGHMFQTIHKILTIGGSGSGITNALLNLINHQIDIDKIYLYVEEAKYAYEAKYQFLNKKPEKVSLKHLIILKLLLNTQMICRISKKTWRVQHRKKPQSISSFW